MRQNCISCNIISPPLSYVRSGNIELFSGTLNDAGIFGHVWSEIVKSSQYNASSLEIGRSSVNALGDRFRYYPFPVHDNISYSIITCNAVTTWHILWHTASENTSSIFRIAYIQYKSP